MLLVALLGPGPRGLRAEDPQPAAPRLRWLVELGAEAKPATLRATPAGDRTGAPLETLWASVPGAALSFAVAEDGRLEKRRRVPADFSTGYGVASAAGGAVVADRDGRVSFFAPAPSAAGDELRWQRDVGDAVLSVAWDGAEQVWVATRDERLLALAARDGAPLWSAQLGSRAAAPALGTASAVYVATKAQELVALDAHGGAQLWRARLDGPVLHPAVFVAAAGHGQPALVICGTWSGTLHAFDAPSGQELWRAALGSRLASAPLVAGERVLVAGEDGSVQAYTRRGAPLWRSEGAVDGAASLLAPDAAAATPGGVVEPAAAARTAAAEARVVAISRRISVLDAASGARRDAYPESALDELRLRFQRAMMEGEGAASAAEQRAAQEREAFSLSGLLFGPPQLHAGGVLFGTEEGWVYHFDAQSLRPTFRYRAGLDASHLYPSASRHLLVSAGEELFALDPASGATAWRRSVGGAVQQVAGDRFLAVLTADRLTELDAVDGTRRWTQPIETAFVSVHEVPAAPEPAAEERPSSWWVDDGASRLQLVETRGRARDALAVDGQLLRPVPIAGSPSWIGATREGRLFRFTAPVPAADAGAALDASPYEIVWEQRLPGAITDLRSSGEAILVRLAPAAPAASGAAAATAREPRTLLIALESEWGEEQWRLPLDESESYRVSEPEGVVLVFGGPSLRVHELHSGSARLVRQLSAPALAAELRGGGLHWVDRAGGAYVADAEHGALIGSTDLGVRLKEATVVPDGFVVLTGAGEVGFVELRFAESPAPGAPPDKGLE